MLQLNAMTSSWYCQGVVDDGGRRYSGTGWYRARVDVTVPAGKSVHLLVPALKGSDLWAWCNGEFAGHLTNPGWSESAIDLTGLLREGGNVIAMRVKGEGGLTIPPFLFTSRD